MWQNRSGTARADPAHTARPRTAEQIADQVLVAAHRGLTVRALGAGHSFSAAAATEGLALDLRHWAGITGAAGDEVTVRSGTVLGDLNTALAEAGLALPMLPDTDAPTVAGALATGTHGTGAALGGLAAAVTALELVLADGTVARCSPTERPDLFAAAPVGLGALGVLTTVTLRCVPSFVLHARRTPMPLSAVLDGFAELATAAEYFAASWLPHGDRVLVHTADRTASSAPSGRSTSVLADLAGATARSGARAMPALAKPLQRMASRTLSTCDYRGRSDAVLTGFSTAPARSVPAEYAVPRGALPAVLTELRARIPRLVHPVALPVEVRVGAAEDGWLAPAHGRATAYVTVRGDRGVPAPEYLALFESIVDGVGGRPHWGTVHTKDAATLAERYPRFGDFLALRDKLDPDRRFANRYLATVLGH